MKQRPRQITSTILKPTLLSIAVAQSLSLHIAQAATINVTCAFDGDCIVGTPPLTFDFCSLREAITSMNSGALEPGCTNVGDAFGTNDTILSFAGGANAITTASELSVTTNDPLTINLSGSSITGAGTHPIINITNTPNLTLENITISNGLDNNYDSSYSGGLSIRNSTVTINSSTISGNSATLDTGGGIFAASSTLAINNSSISSNYGYRGGGIYINANSSLSINSSTVDNNRSQKGGGIYQGGGLLTLTNSTVSNNSAVVYGAGLRINGPSNTVITHTTLHGNSAANGSSIYSFSEEYSDVSISITNSVIADSPTNQECNFYDSGFGVTTLIDGGGNWFEDDTCNGVAQGDPKLDALADNGGPTQTHLPSIASPVRNLSTANCAVNDQRGNARDTSACDAGAVEFINTEIMVDSQTDDGTGCTLRDALLSTSSATLQAGCVPDRSLDGIDGRSILFDPSLAGEAIILNGTELLIDNGQVVELNPTGVAGVSVDGDKSSRLLRIEDSTVSINGLTFQDGYVEDSNSSYGGGGIRAQNASLYLANSTVRNNTWGQYNNSSFGGGIYLHNGNLTMESCTISGNRASNIGGGMFLRSARLNMSNSTISYNTSPITESGDGFVLSTPGPNPSMVINSTIKGNIDVQSSAPNYEDLILQNSILDGSCVGTPANVIDNGGNIFRDATCGTAAQGNPGLLPLADNGGPTMTHALREGSIARNAGVLGLCPLRDQRGKIRNEGNGKCDAGAFELLNSEIPVIFFSIPLPNSKAVVIPL